MVEVTAAAGPVTRKRPHPLHILGVMGAPAKVVAVDGVKVEEEEEAVVVTEAAKVFTVIVFFFDTGMDVDV